MWWTKRKKLAVSCGLSAFSLVLALLARRPCNLLAAAAMGVSTLGDALLAGYPKRLAAGKHRLVKGGLVFLAAHILYIRALLLSFGGEAAALLPHFALPFALFLGMTLLHAGILSRRYSSSAPRAFFAAAFFYLLSVGVHGAAALALWSRVPKGGYGLYAVGTILFYLSDALLLARKYGAIGEKRATDLIWLTYVPAQLCLSAGLFLAG